MPIIFLITDEIQITSMVEMQCYASSFTQVTGSGTRVVLGSETLPR